MKRHSIKQIARRAKSEDAQMRKKAVPLLGAVSKDSFQNFAAKLGLGTDNLQSMSSYGFNPITRNRTMLEWIHRGSWLGGVAVDLVADDMTRAGIDFLGDVEPAQIEEIKKTAVTLQVWDKIKATIKWSRLYGGALGVLLLDGQALNTPLRIDTVGPDMFRGLLALDRWMVEPSLNDVIQEMGPYMGLPKFYTVLPSSPALVGQRIHYTRCIRLTGIELPYWQSMTENLWSISVLERLYDRMVAFDSATTGVAQLIFKSYLRLLKIKDFRDTVASGGPLLNGLTNYVDMMRRFQSIEGVTIIDSEDEFEALTHGAFTGLGEAMMQLGQQLAGALQIPLVRLFGQSPMGMNATGESDLRMYYDGILQRQNSDLLIAVTNVYRCIAASKRIKLSDSFGITFNPLWQLTETEKSEIAGKNAETVVKAQEAGIISMGCAVKELRQQADVTGIFSNITDEDEQAAEEQGPPIPQEEMVAEIKATSGEEDVPGAAKNELGTQDRRRRNNGGRIVLDSKTALVAWHHGLQTVVENPAGSIRRGYNWQVVMPADYGYIRRVNGADGDQLDAYIGNSPESPMVFVIDQRDLKTNAFDEHKVMLGYHTQESAVEDYVLGYTDGTGPDRMMGCTELTMDQFKHWMQHGDTKKPVTDGLNEWLEKLKGLSGRHV